MISHKEKLKLQKQNRKIIRDIDFHNTYDYAYKTGNIGNYCKKNQYKRKLEREMKKFINDLTFQ